MKEFIVECLDHITNAEGALLELESNSEDVDQISVVFRAFHTIKGTSGFLNLDRIQKCAHLAENLLDRARDGEIKITGGYADLALRSCDALRNMIEGLQGLTPGDEMPIPEDLMDLLEILADPEAAGYGEGDLDDDVMRTGDILVGEGKASREQIEEAEKSKGEKKLGEKLVQDKAVKAQDVAGAIRKQQAQKQRSASNLVDSSVRVSTGRLDSLINMVGELVIAQSMVSQDPTVTSGQSPRLQRNVSHAGKIIRELQDLTMSLRMVPLKGVFQKMNRLVRDLARKSGKKVQFVTEGEETEIDRNMVESLNDPLVHMIRNSVDHGVESPEVREQQGKDPTGTVTLRAYHAAGNVVIELQDDGKGLAKDKILAKAAERGLVDGNKELSDQETFMLIFQAGFSTAEKITDVSGRGVGMDVVKRNIESLRGRIEVASKQGEGSTFSIRLPLTMAIADAMILSVGEETYLLPTVSIEQSFRPEPGSISTVSGQGEMVMLRGELLPLFRLHELFGVSNAQTDPYDALLIVIEGDGHRCALMVDELLGQQQVVIKSLGRGMAKVPGVSGGAILGDGRVGLILDATGLLQLAEGRINVEAEAAAV
jgi:two-component system chemotaxis sensor kinase CheA